MATSNVITVQLTAVGGATPYTSFQAPAGRPETSLPTGTYSVAGSTLTVDATTLLPGEYTVYITVTDRNLLTSGQVVNVTVVPSDIFCILNTNQDFEPASFPYTAVIPLSSSGQMGTGAVTWAIIPTVTTLPGVSISNASLTFTLTSFGSWAVGVSATDSFGNTVSKVIVFQVISSAVFQLVDGQVELEISAPPSKVGVQNFTVEVTDSNSATSIQTFNYTVTNPISEVYVEESCFDHYWGSGDVTTVTLPIFGDLAGFSLGPVVLPTLSNGLVATFDSVDGVVEISGPPTSFQNSEFDIPIAVMQGGTQVATITREYTLLSHNGTTSLGQAACYTRPYLVGDTIGLNPLKPFFNSPTVSKPVGTTVSLPLGYFLPPGLSLDANTGLIYGTIAGVFNGYSILQYLDSTLTVVGSVTIYWDINQSTFAIQDNLVDGQIQQAYSGSIAIAGTASSSLVSVAVYSGRLPQGLSFTISSNGQSANLTGTPQEAGQFDVWVKLTNTVGNSSYLYHRILVSYIPVLTFLTTSLPPLMTGVFYQQILQGFGGVQPYTWSLSPTSPALPTGITLTSSGVLSGTPTDSYYSQTILLTLTDSRSPSVAVTQGFSLVINNSLQVTTAALPNIVPGQPYSFAMSATGGTGGYTWSLPSSGFTLPTGITFNSTTGVFSGLFSGVPLPTYSNSVTITVTSGSSTASKSFTLATGEAGLLIDTSGVGLINRGNPYYGVIQSFNAVQPPVQWQVTPNSPNTLPTGLTIQANGVDNGVTAIIAGTTVVKADGTTGYPQIPVTVSAVDSANNSAQAILLMTTYSNLAITTPSLKVATVGGVYSVALQAVGGVAPYTWSIDPTSPTSASALSSYGYTLTSSGVLSGTGTAVASLNLLLKVSDSITPVDSDSQLFSFNIVSSTLAISTTTLTPTEANRAYSMQLVATGGTGTYTWSITGGQLPGGFGLNPSTGVISGTTQSAGTVSLTLTVTDGVNTISTTLPLVVSNGLSLISGIDYIDGTALGTLGYISTSGLTGNINPCPNLSFYVVATGVVSTSASQLVVSLPTGFSYNVTSLVGGIAKIQLLGGFNTGQPGVNPFFMSINDAGVVASNSFTWTVYDDGALSVLLSSGTLPLRTLE